MERSEKRILTTHVGSLVRTPELKALSKSHKDRAAETPSSETYDEILKRSTAEVVKKQAATGVDIISDGEFGKSSWSIYILDRTTGFEIRSDQLRPVTWLGRDLERFGEVIGREMGPATNRRIWSRLKIQRRSTRRHAVISSRGMEA